MSIFSRYKKDNLFILIISLIVLLWFILLFSGFKFPGSGDWDETFTHHELQRITILKYHQIPFWSPYLSGGEPWLAHPNSDFLSPLFIFVLVFGTIEGTIISYFFLALIGLLGMYFLSRYYDVDRSICLLSSALFLNTFNMLALPGAFPFLSVAFLPWAYLFFHKSKLEINYIFYTAALLAFIVLSGSVYIMLIAVLILFLDALFFSASNQRPGFIFNAAVIFLLAFLLSSPKLIPMLELFKHYPRLTFMSTSQSFFNPQNFWNGVVLLYNLLFCRDTTYNVYSLTRFFEGGIFQFSLLIGMIGVFISSCIILWRKYKILVVINVVFLLLFLGDKSPFNLWQLLHYVLPSIRGAHKFFPGLMVTFSLTVGLTLHELGVRFVNTRRFKQLASILLFVIITYVCFSAWKTFNIHQGRAYHLVVPDGEFYQTKGNPERMFETVYQGHAGISNTDRLDVIGNQIKTRVLARENQGYRGEYYLLSGFGQVDQIFFSPNKLVFKLKLVENDALVINQNYFTGWHPSVGQLAVSGGLLSVALDKMQTELTLYYLPTSFLVGVVLFIISTLLFFILKTKKVLRKQ